MLLMSACVGGDEPGADSFTQTDSSVPATDSASADSGDTPVERVGGPPLPAVVINELVAVNSGAVLADDGLPADWLELYNDSDETVSLAGYHLTDDWRVQDRHTLGADAVLPPRGFLVLWADGDTAAGAAHLNFELSDMGESVGLFSPDGAELDWLSFPALGDDVALARLPDGGPELRQVSPGTPGSANRDLVVETLVAVPTASTWAYEDSGTDLGTAWREPGYDSSGWAQGPGPLGYGDNQTTELSYGPDSSDKHTTAYFLTAFALDDPAWATTATVGVRRDDGAAVYLNGVEVLRTALPEGELTHDTAASATASSTDETTYFAFDVDPGLLTTGLNVLAAEVHQASSTSSDLSFDLTLTLETVRERE